MKRVVILTIAVLALVLSSCSGLRIEKRHYSGGFYVETGSKNKNYNKAEVLQEQPSVNNASAVNDADTRTPEMNAPRTETAPANTPVFSGKENIDVQKAPEVAEKTSEYTEGAATPVSQEQQNHKSATQEEQKPAPASDVPLWVYVVLALLLPPLAVYLKQGLTNIFWLDLILFILGYGLFRFSYFLWGASLAAVVIALLVVFDVM
jgi:uncharacterized membrane protein YqaE (UPF0057 family)